MNLKSFFLTILFFIGCLLPSKGEERYGATDIADLVLIYQGGVHRPMKWTKEQFLPYVVHQDQKGNVNWLFDGFLFLEFTNGSGRNYAPGYNKLNARKEEWMWLQDRQFAKDTAFSALDRCIGEQIKRLGKPGFKHQLVVGIPSPILNQQDWGEIGGKAMDFSKVEDRIEAGKWYIDRFLERFAKQQYKNLHLAGFYWVDEDVIGCADILEALGDYIRSKKLKFYWIPYWKARGFDKWKAYKFDFAWLQPNHFFDKKIEEARIDQACELARQLNMGVEMEFDRRALADHEANMRDRLISYINRFEQNGVFDQSPVAYYEGGNGIYLFSQSENPKDKELIDLLAGYIIKRKQKNYFSSASTRANEKSQDQIVYLENAKIRLGFDKINGSLKVLEDLSCNQALLDTLSEAQTPWQIIFYDPAGNRVIDMSSSSRFNYEKTGASSLRLRWSKFQKETNPDFEVTVSVRLDDEQASSFWKISLGGIKGQHIEKVVFPKITGLKDLGEENLAVSSWMGSLLKNPRAYFTETNQRYFAWPYPGHTSMQLLALYNPNKIGFYASCNDSMSYRKNFGIGLDASSRMFYQIDNFPEHDPELDAYSPAYEAVIGSFKGDWIDAATQYRQWAVSQKWAKNSRLKNGLVPAWVEQTALWVWNRSKSSGVLVPAVDLKKRLGLPVNVLWHWWHGCSYDDGFPEYFPPREGKDLFIEQVKAAKEEGVRPLIYMNQIQWGTSTDSWKAENASRYSVKDIKGKEITTVYNIFSGKSMTTMCLGTDFWKDKYAVLADSAINHYHASGIYMDQACLSYLCFDSTHQHPSGGGNYWVNNFAKLTEKIRAQSIASEKPVLSGEGVGENWLPYLDLFLTLQVSKERYAGVEGWETIPLFQAVYHQYAISYGSYSSLLSPPYDELWPKEFVPPDTLQLLDKTFNQQFLLEQARSFVWGIQPMIANYRSFLATERKSEIDYLLKLAKVRAQGLKYLLHGEFLRAPEMLFPEKEIDFSKLSIYVGRDGKRVTALQGAYPLVYAAAWKADDGSIGLAMASIMPQSFPLKFRINADTYGLPASGEVFMIDELGRRKIASYKQGKIDIDYELPPEGICILELVPQ